MIVIFKNDNKYIGLEIRNLSNLIKRNAEKSQNNKYFGNKGVRCWAIGYFYDNREKDIFQKDFEKRFSIRRSTASNMLSAMEKSGFIKRFSFEGDARLKKIVLTEKAVEIHEHIKKEIEIKEKRLRKGLSEEEIAIFFEISKKIQANLEELN